MFSIELEYYRLFKYFFCKYNSNFNSVNIYGKNIYDMIIVSYIGKTSILATQDNFLYINIKKDIFKRIGFDCNIV